MAETPITKQQRAIYERIAAEVQAAQARLNLFISTIIAGAGIESASVTEVTDTAIVYTTEESDLG